MSSCWVLASTLSCCLFGARAAHFHRLPNPYTDSSSDTDVNDRNTNYYTYNSGATIASYFEYFGLLELVNTEKIIYLESESDTFDILESGFSERVDLSGNNVSECFIFLTNNSLDFSNDTSNFNISANLDNFDGINTYHIDAFYMFTNFYVAASSSLTRNYVRGLTKGKLDEIGLYESVTSSSTSSSSTSSSSYDYGSNSGIEIDETDIEMEVILSFTDANTEEIYKINNFTINSLKIRYDTSKQEFKVTVGMKAEFNKNFEFEEVEINSFQVWMNWMRELKVNEGLDHFVVALRDPMSNLTHYDVINIMGDGGLSEAKNIGSDTLREEMEDIINAFTPSMMSSWLDDSKSNQNAPSHILISIIFYIFVLCLSW